VRWRKLLEEYRTAVRREIVRCEGLEIDAAGDGLSCASNLPRVPSSVPALSAPP